MNFFETALLNPTYRDDRTSLQALRERVLSANFVILASFGTLGYVVFLISDIIRGMSDPSYLREIPFTTLGYGLIMAAALIRKLPFAVRAGVLIFALYAVTITDKLAAGLGGIGELLLIVISVLLVIFFGGRGAVIAVVLVLAAMGIPGWLMTSGQMPLPEREAALSADPAGWAMTTFALLIFAAMLMVSAAVLMRGVTSARTPK